MAQVGSLKRIALKANSLPLNLRVFSVGVTTLLNLFVKPRIKFAALKVLTDLICPERFACRRFNFVRGHGPKPRILQTEV